MPAAGPSLQNVKNQALALHHNPQTAGLASQDLCNTKLAVLEGVTVSNISLKNV